MNSYTMTTPEFVEDSNAVSLAPILQDTIDKLNKNADKYDYIMAFFITLMSESGYRVACLYDAKNKIWSEHKTCIPDNWKAMEKDIYEIDFLLYNRKEVECKLIGIPIGDWLILNLLPKGTIACKTRSITVNVPKYVNLHQKELNKFWHLKELALSFKNNLLAPLHGEMLMEFGIASPSLQGLPQELKSVISGMLDNKSRINLEESCTNFKGVSHNH